MTLQIARKQDIQHISFTDMWHNSHDYRKKTLIYDALEKSKTNQKHIEFVIKYILMPSFCQLSI